MGDLWRSGLGAAQDRQPRRRPARCSCNLWRWLIRSTCGSRPNVDERLQLPRPATAAARLARPAQPDADHDRHVSPPAGTRRPAACLPRRGAALETRLASAVQAFAYLDADHLQEARSSPGYAHAAPDETGRPSLRSAAAFAASMPAPERQRALVDDLIALLREQPRCWTPGEPDAAASLRLYTALIARARAGRATRWRPHFWIACCTPAP
ncbi:MAG: hypothetical protein U0521_22480 [Anaerolineae bacterium]